MHPATVLLANAAEVRDGLVYVLGGGIHHLWVAELPTEVSPTVVLIVDLEAEEAHRPFTAHVRVTSSTGDIVVDVPLPPALPPPPDPAADVVRVATVFRTSMDVREPGLHHLGVHVDGAEIAGTDFVVAMTGR